MKYILLIYATENSALTQEEYAECVAESTQLCHELAAQGKFVAASPLHPVSTATCVRVRGGAQLTTDGPFAETTEQLGGYFLIDVPDLDEAIAIAARLPCAIWGTIEIRPLVEVPGMPEAQTIKNGVQTA